MRSAQLVKQAERRSLFKSLLQSNTMRRTEAPLAQRSVNVR